MIYKSLDEVIEQMDAMIRRVESDGPDNPFAGNQIRSATMPDGQRISLSQRGALETLREVRGLAVMLKEAGTRVIDR